MKVPIFLACMISLTNGQSVWNYTEAVPRPENATAASTTENGSVNGTEVVTKGNPTDDTVGPGNDSGFTDAQLKDCQSQIGTIENDVVLNTMPKYDILKILDGLGGPPGKVNSTRLNTTEQPLPADELDIRPLPDADKPHWLYDYKSSDYRSFIRLEHAMLRFNNTEHEFIDVRGEVWWTPPNFCNWTRHANYRRDDTGFYAEVSLEYCSLAENMLWCAPPANCFSNSTTKMCVAAPSSAVIATLVG